MKNQEAVEKYQCKGCLKGDGFECYSKNYFSMSCDNHVPATRILGLGKILLGLPKGFNRLGEAEEINISINETFCDSPCDYDMFNVPVWKHLTKDGHTIVRGYSPRINKTYIDIFLEDCINYIDCIEISFEDIKKMD